MSIDFFFSLFCRLSPAVSFQLLSLSKPPVFHVWLSGTITVCFALAVLTGDGRKLARTRTLLFSRDNGGEGAHVQFVWGDLDGSCHLTTAGWGRGRGFYPLRAGMTHREYSCSTYRPESLGAVVHLMDIKIVMKIVFSTLLSCPCWCFYVPNTSWLT